MNSLHEDLVRRGFTRRGVLRALALASAGSVLPFSSERALAQLSNVGALPEDAVKINANEFPEGPSKRALEALAKVAAQGNRYQYPETDALVAAAAKLEGLEPRHYSVYPGSSLALHHAVISFTSPRKALVTADPGYEAAARAAEFIGATVVRVPLAKSGAHDLAAMLAAANAQPTGLVYVCNPNNPTGTVSPRAEIEALIAGKPKDTVVLLDEAYIHFCDEPPAVDLVRGGRDVVVLRTFSKIYGMAGLRAGFAMARPDLLARMTGWNTGALLRRARLRLHGVGQPHADGRREEADAAGDRRARTAQRLRRPALVRLADVGARLDRLEPGPRALQERVSRDGRRARLSRRAVSSDAPGPGSVIRSRRPSGRPSASVTRMRGVRRFVRRSFTITGSAPRPNTQSSDHSRSAVSTGRSASPFSVSRYSKRPPASPTSTFWKIPCSTRRCRRSDRMFLAMPRLASKSPKRRAPKNASRTTRSVHQSPNCSSAWAMPQFMSAKRFRPIATMIPEVQLHYETNMR
jgi:histidinol-phosphate/aromatic aminotransferase/cobyric acid decarboxylase-like protein